MTNSLLWLAYIVSGVIAFAVAYRKRWSIVPSIIAGTLVGLLLSMLVMLMVPREEAIPWIQVDLAMNGSLSLIFAGAGAAIGYAIRSSRG